MASLDKGDGSGVYCDRERPWMCTCEVEAAGKAYVDAICEDGVQLSAAWGKIGDGLDSVKCNRASGVPNRRRRIGDQLRRHVNS